jgi:hypothetical protein
LPGPPSNRKIVVKARAARVDFTGAVMEEQTDRHDESRAPKVVAQVMQSEARVTFSDPVASIASMGSSSDASLVSIDSTATEEQPLRILEPPRILPGDRHTPSLEDDMLDLSDDEYLEQLEEQRPASKPPASQLFSKESPEPSCSILKMLVIVTLVLVAVAIAGVLVHFFA